MWLTAPEPKIAFVEASVQTEELFSTADRLLSPRNKEPLSYRPDQYSFSIHWDYAMYFTHHPHGYIEAVHFV